MLDPPIVPSELGKRNSTPPEKAGSVSNTRSNLSTVSPELVLVDPELAALTRQTPEEPSSGERAGGGDEVARRAPFVAALDESSASGDARERLIDASMASDVRASIVPQPTRRPRRFVTLVPT